MSNDNEYRLRPERAEAYAQKLDLYHFELYFIKERLILY